MVGDGRREKQLEGDSGCLDVVFLFKDYFSFEYVFVSGFLFSLLFWHGS